MPEVIIKDTALITGLIEQKLRIIDNLVNDRSLTLRGDSSRGDLLSSVQLALRDFLASIKRCSTASAMTRVVRGNINSSEQYNAFWGAVNDDLVSLYKEADRLGDLLKDHHNYVMADIQNLLIQLKAVNSRLANYGLYAETLLSNERNLTDNFSDTSKLELNSPLLGKSECTVDMVQGVVTLAISSEELVKKDGIADIVISSVNSNGQAYGSTNLLSTINSGDFYLYEYEITSEGIQPNKVTLDFTIKLEEMKILNFLRIVPNNFGTKTWPKITALDVSEDGITMNSIRNELLGNGASEDQFTLAPYTSNYAGEGRYSFLPKRVKFVHITIEQTAPYFDVARNLYRWVVGIKNIELWGRKFENESELISRDYTITKGIEQVAFDADELPNLLYSDTLLASEADIKHEVSVDGGMRWYKIAPQYLSTVDPEAPELIYVNAVDETGGSTGLNHIQTEYEATNIRYRLRLSKNETVIDDPELAEYYSPIVRSIILKIITKEVL
ncbi:MAG: hypothetical protein WC932_05005 [archaeon]|jgi:hypothetical protein